MIHALVVASNIPRPSNLLRAHQVTNSVPKARLIWTIHASGEDRSIPRSPNRPRHDRGNNVLRVKQTSIRLMKAIPLQAMDRSATASSRAPNHSARRGL